MVDVESIDPRIEKIRQLGGAQDFRAMVAGGSDRGTHTAFPRLSEERYSGIKYPHALAR